MKRPTMLLLSTAVLLALAAAPASADDRSLDGGETGLKAMWLDATATIGDWFTGLLRSDRDAGRRVAGASQGDLGSTLDPDGYTAEDGPSNDPDGGRSSGEGGPDLDPNG